MAAWMNQTIHVEVKVVVLFVSLKPFNVGDTRLDRVDAVRIVTLKPQEESGYAHQLHCFLKSLSFCYALIVLESRFSPRMRGRELEEQQ